MTQCNPSCKSFGPPPLRQSRGGENTDQENCTTLRSLYLRDRAYPGGIYSCFSKEPVYDEGTE